jgi:hypothetical protein
LNSFKRSYSKLCFQFRDKLSRNKVAGFLQYSSGIIEFIGCDKRDPVLLDQCWMGADLRVTIQFIWSVKYDVENVPAGGEAGEQELGDSS